MTVKNFITWISGKIEKIDKYSESHGWISRMRLKFSRADLLAIISAIQESRLDNYGLQDFEVLIDSLLNEGLNHGYSGNINILDLSRKKELLRKIKSEIHTYRQDPHHPN